MQAVIRNTQMKDCACVTKLYFPTINHIGKSFASSTLNYSNLSILLSSSHTSIFTYSSTFNSVWEVNIRSENTPQRYAKLRKVNIAFKLRGSNRMGSRSIVCSGWGRKGSGRKHEGLRKSPEVFGLRTAESYQSLYIFSIINKAAFMHSSFGLFWKKHTHLSQSSTLSVQMLVLWFEVTLKNRVYLGVREWLQDSQQAKQDHRQHGRKPRVKGFLIRKVA